MNSKVYYTVNTKTKSTYGGYVVSVKAYKWVDDEPLYLGLVSWNTRAYAGEVGEINKQLKTQFDKAIEL